MTELDLLKIELPRFRALSQKASPDEAAIWSDEESAKFHFEVQWCIEALRELDARVTASVQQK